MATVRRYKHFSFSLGYYFTIICAMINAYRRGRQSFVHNNAILPSCKNECPLLRDAHYCIDPVIITRARTPL